MSQWFLHPETPTPLQSPNLYTVRKHHCANEWRSSHKNSYPADRLHLQDAEVLWFMWEEPDRKSLRLAKFLMGKVFSSISRCFLPGLILQIMAMSITDLVSLITYYYCHVQWLTKLLLLLSRISPLQHEWNWWRASVCVLIHITLGFGFYPIAQVCY